MATASFSHSSTPSMFEFCHPPADCLSPSLVCGSYKVDYDQMIGAGTHGSAYVCEDVITKQKFCCKIVRRDTFPISCDWKEKVVNEILIMKRLNGHPNVVGLREFQEEEDTVYIVMDLCDGGDLLDEIELSGSISEDSAREIVKQALEGIIFFHSQGIIHRDLKLENILLLKQDRKKESIRQQNYGASICMSNSGKNMTRQSKALAVKIADFGEAVQLKKRSDKIYGLAGSPYYIAPEIARNESYDFKVDIWSMGIVLYTLLTGEWPSSHDPLTDSSVPKDVKMEFSEQSLHSVSPEARHFLSWLLKTNASERPSATAAFQHPWFDTSL
eukprot:TRINITY_DN6353_c0_g1_i1.p1 TRINITY_DN6353_c0_g1~~TRINITY_DN6353_c0_g1_i1.p1  ORF type:complete len:336 (+),score=29.37 TRINITY_DN6353_c0_g1_i1:23-1009(+)